MAKVMIHHPGHPGHGADTSNALQKVPAFDALIELHRAQRQIDALSQRCALLESTIATLLENWVPPSSFLPPFVWSTHREAIEMINEYALL